MEPVKKCLLVLSQHHKKASKTLMHKSHLFKTWAVLEQQIVTLTVLMTVSFRVVNLILEVTLDFMVELVKGWLLILVDLTSKLAKILMHESKLSESLVDCKVC